MDPEVVVNHTLLETGQRGHHLVGGARGVLSLQGAVVEGSARVSAQRGPLVPTDADGKEVRIEARTTGQDQHLAVAGVERNHGPGIARLIQRGLGLELQPSVERQDDVLAGLRLDLSQQLELATVRVHEQVLAPVPTAHIGV